MATDYNHQVFRNDPIYLSNFIGKYASVSTKYSATFKGFITAIDPVSESLIISQVVRNREETLMLLGHSIKSIEIENPPSDTVIKAASAPLERINQPEDALKKIKVHNWLSKNLLPVEDINGVLHVHGGNVCISPPYEYSNCISNNSIILGRIQHLLQRMPE